jgi:phosphoenolpyruvate-protein phosphotransferase (PTS system enzyme I)
MPRVERVGRAAAPGIALGPLVRFDEAALPQRNRGTPAEEAAALNAALAAAIADLAALAERAGGDAAEIVGFQIAMLEDPALSEPALAGIATGMAADLAWGETLAAQVAEYETAEDAYFQARAADLRDLAERVLRHLLGGAAEAAVPPGAVVLAEDLTPSRFLAADWGAGSGVALEAGSPASHVAMLARARGVPMVTSLGPVESAGHTEAALDGAAGLLLLSPTAADRAALGARMAVRETVPATAAVGPALTATGRRIQVLINVADPSDLDGLDPAICDGVGLTRTELLFADGPPDEETQVRAYRRILDWAAGRPVTIRTLDAGGDKPVRGLTVARESNPFLGQRGIRLSLAHPDIFAVQLRALARAAAHGPLKVMLPMVTIPEELEAAAALLNAAVAELAVRGGRVRRPPLGMMVEVPAAALAIGAFEAEFYSIGSNDLTQYVTASARDVGAVAGLADVRNPGVLRLIREVAEHGRATGREVSVCGDAAGEPALVPLLLAAGIDTLSMPPNAVAAVKAAIANCD